mmetsp:Transcript_6515/g.18789  ORF Transcript_6515/g.18789 Transcript_6515/m.18789 type:complete len:233 (-) Transcript_6515:24-722(-)
MLQQTQPTALTTRFHGLCGRLSHNDVLDGRPLIPLLHTPWQRVGGWEVLVGAAQSVPYEGLQPGHAPNGALVYWGEGLGGSQALPPHPIVERTDIGEWLANSSVEVGHFLDRIQTPVPPQLKRWPCRQAPQFVGQFVLKHIFVLKHALGRQHRTGQRRSWPDARVRLVSCVEEVWYESVWVRDDDEQVTAQLTQPVLQLCQGLYQKTTTSQQPGILLPWCRFEVLLCDAVDG